MTPRRASTTPTYTAGASGRSGRELRELFAGDQRVTVLVKPYTAPLLLDALAAVGIATAS